MPDKRRPNFAAACRRQAALVAKEDQQDTDLSYFMYAAQADLDDCRRSAAIW
ncbi:antitoxin MazE-like protein [Phaeobacter sp.]|uniref:antitoxin MazE-like protein n=1 Tax=Phaeobacter sp. TaxID=1902409 RepID=UPI0025E11E93|nr:antitoxin MazE-like protein [Phaeobacter sp.]